MHKDFESLSWQVKNFDCNEQLIKDYDILKYREDFIKALKKKCLSKEEFSNKMRREMRYHFWSKAEYELIIEVDINNHIWLTPWCGCRKPENVRIDVTNTTNFDWQDFAKLHINKQIFKNKAKIDIFDQLDYRWSEFIDYLWYTRLKYERRNSKFDK